ncbi:MAG: helix-turn-helix transcriptional regulator [Actinomycetota bacterium]|nr:helix-turn-helix transcriptional regulator [Actinomycetota bacterium]
MEIADGFGERLRRFRVERGMTQAQLAGKYSAAYVSMIEAGRKVPSPAAVRQFADKLGVTIQELALGVPSNLEAEILVRMQEGWRFLYLGDYGQADKAFRGCERDARRFGYRVLQAKAVVGRAWCAERQGQTGDAIEGFERALGLYDAHAPAPAAVEAVAGIARCQQMSGSARLALDTLERYLLELERKDLVDPSALMRVYASLVWPYCELGLRQKATDVAVKALRLQARVDNPEQIAGMHLNVARALLNDGQPLAAMESLNKAEEIFRDLNWQTEIARAQINRGIVLLAEGNRTKARDEMRAALKTFRAVGFTRDEARTLNELARLERLLGDVSTAETLARQALELLTEMEAVPELALTHRELGLCLSERDREHAEAHLRRATVLYDQCGETVHAADTYRLLGELLEPFDPSAGRDAYHAGLRLIAQTLEVDD